MALQFSGFQQAVWWWLLAAVASLAGAMFVDRKFFLNVKKPKFAPPPWLFGIVWPILYALQAQASYLVQRELEQFGWQCWFYLAFLIVSTAWTPIFFQLRLMIISLIVIFASLLLAILVTVFYGVICTTSGLFMAPTAAWILFASWLNWRIYALNSPETLRKKLRDECDVLTCSQSKRQTNEDVVYEAVVPQEEEAFQPDDNRFFANDGVYDSGV